MGSAQTAAVPAPGDAPGDRARRGALVAGAWALASAPLALGWPRCPLAWWLGAPCPTCGVTRALRLFAAGHVEASLRLHPLAIPASLSVAVFALATIDAAFAPRSAPAPRGFARVAFGALAAVYAAAVVLWIARALGYAGGPVPIA